MFLRRQNHISLSLWFFASCFISFSFVSGGITVVDLWNYSFGFCSPSGVLIAAHVCPHFHPPSHFLSQTRTHSFFTIIYSSRHATLQLLLPHCCLLDAIVVFKEVFICMGIFSLLCIPLCILIHRKLPILLFVLRFVWAAITNFRFWNIVRIKRVHLKSYAEFFEQALLTLNRIGL